MWLTIASFLSAVYWVLCIVSFFPTVVSTSTDNSFTSTTLIDSLHAFLLDVPKLHVYVSTQSSKAQRLRIRARKLLANPFVVSQCSWNKDLEVCEVDMKYALNPFDERGNTYQILLSDILECDAISNKNSCTHRGCSWDSNSRVCWKQDVGSDYGTSPCVQGAPLLFDGLAGTLACSRRSNTISCNSDQNCYWNENSNACAFDTWNYLLGIKILSGGLMSGFTEATRSTVKELREKVESEKKDAGKSFEWDSVLDLSLSSLTCPTGIKQEVCNATNALSSLLLTDIYCQGKYLNKTARQCDADKLCDSGFANEITCAANSELRIKAEDGYYEELFSAIENEFNQQFMRNTYECSSATTNSTCVAPDCVWNDNSSSCKLSDSWLLEQVTTPQKATKERDPVCQYYFELLNSVCLDAQQESCIQQKTCQWSVPSNSCQTKVQAIVQSWLRDDSAMAKEVDSIRKKCETHVAQQDCV